MRTTHPLKTIALSWVIAGTLAGASAFAQTPAAPPPPPAAAPAAAAPAVAGPTDSERIGALEAYIGNTDPGAAFAAHKVKDKDGNDVLPETFKAATLGTAGPGHNAWMMVSSALVLFMTLPGLALFYGGLVRKKEHPVRHRPMFRHHRSGDNPLGRVRL